jgi:hypothetical protein
LRRGWLGRSCGNGYSRIVAPLDVVKSDLSGRAVFRKGEEELEVFSANKRPLEKVMGVDLV